MSNSIHADAGNTVRISARRFEQSPYAEFYTNADTVNGVYAGRFYSIFNGEDGIEAYWTLRRKAVLYDVPERPVQIEGPDAVAFLERVFARPIASLQQGRGRYAIACTPAGGLFMDGILFRLTDNRFWYVQPDGALESWLVAHSDGFDVTISDPGSRVIQIQGPASPAILQTASAGQIDEKLGYFHSGFFDLGGQELYVSRTGWTGEMGYEIYSQGDSTDYKRLWDHLMGSGEPHGMMFGSITSMEIRRIEAAILDNLSDFDRTMTPFQAGLGAFIDLDKPDFIGRQALLNADRRCLLFGLRCDSATPDMNDMVLHQEKALGRVTAGAWSPYLKTGIGYVRFDQPGEWIGKIVTLKQASGQEFPCEIVELPFYDAEKRIPRGLDRELP